MLSLEMGPDLTRSKKEADPALTQVLFDPTWWELFWAVGQKIETCVIFGGKFPDPNPHQKMADPTRPEQQKFDPDPSLTLSL